jgi:hypothetical protein
LALFEFGSTEIKGLDRVEFAGLGILERSDLQRLLRDHADVISPDTLIISEEFSSWDRSDRRIDLLGVDRQGRLVVLELKRTTDDSWADLQALRYAAMISQMTFDEAVEHFGVYLRRRGRDADARSALLAHLGWSDPSAGTFGSDTRIILAAADFSPEVTSTVLWLNERDLDIMCVRLQPYRLGGTIVLDVQQIIPLPEAADYQIQIRQKQREARTVAEQSSDWTRYDVTTEGGEQGRLYKREVMLEAVRQLLRRGVSPKEIAGIAGRHIFEIIDGRADSATVQAELTRRRPNDAGAARRYFIREDQLFHVEDKTYVLTNQWSKSTMETTLGAFSAKFGNYGFEVRVSAE